MSFGAGFAQGLMAGQSLASNLYDVYNKGQAGEAYKAGSEQRSTDVMSGEDAMAHFKKNYVAQPGGPATAEDYIAANPQAFAGLTNRAGGKEYSVGVGDNYQAGGKEFSQNQRRAAGLQAAGDYYYGIGDVDKGSDAQSKGTSLRMAELGLSKAEREEATQKRTQDVMAKWEKPEDRLKELYNNDVGRYNNGMKGEVQKLSNGSYAMWHVDKDGNEVEGSTSIMTPAQVQEHQQRAMVADLLSADPTNVQLLMKAQEMGIKREEIDMHREHNANEGKHWARSDATNEQYRRDQATNNASENQRKADETKREWGYTDENGKNVPGWRDRYLGVLQQRANNTGGLSGVKADRMKKYDDMDDDFQTALEGGDFATARQISSRLGMAPDQRGLATIKVKDKDGNEDVKTINRYDEMVNAASQRAGLSQARELQRGLKAEYPKAKIDDVAVDVETGDRVVVSGGKHIPLADFIAQQDKKFGRGRGLQR